MGTTRPRLTSPTVGLSPTRPSTAAGQLTEPWVSVPIAPSTSPDATAAALPEDEPHGLRSSACGFRVWPPTPLQPEIEAFERMFAHSDKFVLPSITASSARTLTTTPPSHCLTMSPPPILPA